MLMVARWRMRWQAANRWRELRRQPSPCWYRAPLARSIVQGARDLARVGLIGFSLITLPQALTFAVAAAAVPAAPAPTGFAKPTTTVAAAPLAYFDWFEYTGHDSVFNQPLPAGTHRNPVLAGFYPDP